MIQRGLSKVVDKLYSSTKASFISPPSTCYFVLRIRLKTSWNFSITKTKLHWVQFLEFKMAEYEFLKAELESVAELRPIRASRVIGTLAPWGGNTSKSRELKGLD